MVPMSNLKRSYVATKILLIQICMHNVCILAFPHCHNDEKLEKGGIGPKATNIIANDSLLCRNGFCFIFFKSSLAPLLYLLQKSLELKFSC